MQSEEIDVHNRKQKYEHSLEMLEQSDISIKNKEIIKRFLKDIEKKDRVGIGRLEKNARVLLDISLMLKKDFEQATKDDIDKLEEEINHRTVQRNGKKWAEWTKCDYRIIIKRFYRWLYGMRRGEYPELVRDLATSFKKSHKLPEEMLTEDDIQKMVNVTQNPRDRALIMLLFDGGLRIGEALNLRIKHIKIDGEEASLFIPYGKTGSRRILLIPATPYLASWLSYHPHRDNPEALLFESPRLNGRIWNCTCIRKKLIETGRKVGVTKPLNPHSFRHASATYYAKLGLSHSQLCVRYGWKQSSEMPCIYIHLSGQDLDNATRKAFGKVTEERKDDNKLMPKACSYCDYLNEWTNTNCSKCGRPLDYKTAIQLRDKRELFDNLVEKLLSDPRIKEKALEIMGQLKK